MNVLTAATVAYSGSLRAMAYILVGVVLCNARLPAASASDAMNEAMVPVADGSKKVREAAFPRALLQVFSKWSGQREPSGAGLAAELSRAGDLVQQYRYRKSEGGDAAGSSARALWVRFEAAPVLESMRRAGIDVWSAERPSPLVWAALGDGEGVDLVALDSEDGVDRALTDAAWRRGLPLRLPLLDLEDRIRVDPHDVWKLEEKVLTEASSRYSAGPVVGVRVERAENGEWQASWRLWDAGRSAQWRSTGAGVGETLAAGVDELADRLVARYALASRETEPVEITVNGVRALDEYGRLMAYLRGLGGVSDVALLQTRGETMRFRMNVAGGADGLRRMVALGDLLKPDGADYRLGP